MGFFQRAIADERVEVDALVFKQLRSVVAPFSENDARCRRPNPLIAAGTSFFAFADFVGCFGDALVAENALRLVLLVRLCVLVVTHDAMTALGGRQVIGEQGRLLLVAGLLGVRGLHHHRLKRC